MSLKKLFSVMKNDGGLLIPAIDRYLLNQSIAEDDDADRGHGLNSPSGIGGCIKAQFYRRTGEASNDIIEPRTRRIFDNGHGVHDRLQTYLEKCGKLMMREVPVWNKDYEVIGHCDGVVKISPIQLAILEIKSINDNGFNALMDAKEEHKKQAQVYMWAIEELRLKLADKKFNEKKYLDEYKKLMQGFVQEGHKYTKEQKIEHAINNMKTIISLLKEHPKKITEMIFLYENKNSQDLKEYSVKWDNDFVATILDSVTVLNKHVKENTVPARPEDAPNKSCSFCRYCNYKNTCWRV